MAPVERDLFGCLVRVPGGVAAPARQQLDLSLTVNLVGASQGAPPIRLEVWRMREGETMRATTEQLPDAVAFGQAWAAALRRRYPVGRSAAKHVARDFRVELRTAEGWLAGQGPQARALLRAFVLFGPAMLLELAAVEPTPAAEEAIAAQVRELQAQLDQLGQAIVTLRRGG